MKFYPKGPINNESILVQVVAWCQTGDKPLPKPKVTKMYNATWHHQASFLQIYSSLNTLKPRWYGCHLADDILKCIFLNENVPISIKISLKFVPKGPIKNIPALVWIMAWHRPGDKPLSEPMMFDLLMHICITLSQWVNIFSADLHNT